MALGGGSWAAQNKMLPGTYINFVSAAKTNTAVSDRGVVAMPLTMDWGVDDEIFEVSAEDLQTKSLQIFGYPYESPKLMGVRDLFRHAKTAYFYKLNKGVAASSKYGTAKCTGNLGNHIRITVSANVDEPEKFDVQTLFGNTTVDEQTAVTNATLKSNAYVAFKPGLELETDAGTPMTGGTNGNAVTGAEYQAFLEKIESYSFNVLACNSTTPEVKNLFVAFTKRLRDEVGMKFQTVLHQKSDADFEGVISVENEVDITESEGNISDLIYWVAGLQAGCGVNKSTANAVYNGEYTVKVDYTQKQLSDALQNGKYILHRVNNGVRVLDDINTLLTYTAEKGKDFARNQVVRVLDQIAIDTALIFNDRFLGRIQNNESGRMSFWSALVDHHKELEKLQAIEAFEASDIVVTQGENRQSIVVTDVVQPVDAMTHLYMTVTVG